MGIGVSEAMPEPMEADFRIRKEFFPGVLTLGYHCVIINISKRRNIQQYGINAVRLLHRATKLRYHRRSRSNV